MKSKVTVINCENSKKKKLTLDCWLLFRSDNGQLIEGNHTVVATARGVFDHQGGVLESPETGKLDVHV